MKTSAVDLSEVVIRSFAWFLALVACASHWAWLTISGPSGRLHLLYLFLLFLSQPSFDLLDQLAVSLVQWQRVWAFDFPLELMFSCIRSWRAGLIQLSLALNFWIGQPLFMPTCGCG